MVKYMKIFCSKILVTVVLLLIQLSWYVFFMIKLTEYSSALNILFNILSILIVLFIINKEDNSAYKFGWILLILILPLFGGLLYLSVGNKRPSRRLRRVLDAEHRKMKGVLVQDPAVMEEIKALDERAYGTNQYLLRRSDWAVYNNTATTYYPVGEEMYRDMLEELERAEHFIFLEYFIIEEGQMWNRILEILADKAQAGVDVRLIYDDVGSLFLLPRSFIRDLEEQGVKCMAFNPFIPVLSLAMNNRDHRKILVVDGHTGFNGGINLSDEYINARQRFGHWKDTGIRLKGEGVWNFTVMFLEMWYAFNKERDNLDELRPHFYHQESFEADGFVQPYGDTPLDEETVGENLYIEILNQARRYVYIFTPYLIIDNEMKGALCVAAKRGVDVRIVTPGIPDKKLVFRLTRSYYEPLLKAGVKIYEYTPGFIHAKSYICDDEIAVVGTINMDYRSLYLHFECGTYLYRTKTVMDLKQDSIETIGKSKEITVEESRAGFWGGLLNAALRLLAPMM